MAAQVFDANDQLRLCGPRHCWIVAANPDCCAARSKSDLARRLGGRRAVGEPIRRGAGRSDETSGGQISPLATDRRVHTHRSWLFACRNAFETSSLGTRQSGRSRSPRTDSLVCARRCRKGRFACADSGARRRNDYSSASPLLAQCRQQQSGLRHCAIAVKPWLPQEIAKRVQFGQLKVWCYVWHLRDRRKSQPIGNSMTGCWCCSTAGRMPRVS